MIWKIGAVIGGCVGVLLTIAAGFLVGDIYVLQLDRQARILDAMPPGLRTAYLDNLFSNPSPDCNRCYPQMVGALQAMRDDLVRGGDGYSYDHSKLAPLIAGRMDAYNEPVPVVACDVMMFAHQRRAMAALVRMAATDRSSVEACVLSARWHSHDLHPRLYPAVRQSVLATPELKPFFLEPLQPAEQH